MGDRLPGCKAQRHGDQLQCDRCGFSWDVCDLEPPECKTSHKLGCETLKQILEGLK